MCFWVCMEGEVFFVCRLAGQMAIIFYRFFYHPAGAGFSQKTPRITDDCKHPRGALFVVVSYSNPRDVYSQHYGSFVRARLHYTSTALVHTDKCAMPVYSSVGPLHPAPQLSLSRSRTAVVWCVCDLSLSLSLSHSLSLYLSLSCLSLSLCEAGKIMGGDRTSGIASEVREYYT